MQDGEKHSKIQAEPSQVSTQILLLSPPFPKRHTSHKQKFSPNLSRPTPSLDHTREGGGLAFAAAAPLHRHINCLELSPPTGGGGGKKEGEGGGALGLTTLHPLKAVSYMHGHFRMVHLKLPHDHDSLSYTCVQDSSIVHILEKLTVCMYGQEGSVPTLAYQMGVRNLEMRGEISGSATAGRPRGLSG